MPKPGGFGVACGAAPVGLPQKNERIPPAIGQLLAGAKPRGRVGFCLMPPVDARLRSRLRSAVGGDRMLVPGLFFCLLLSVDRSPIP
ncbi:MAG: hypothetical protein ACK43N_00025, partial [Pirellulaceae bacterium]